MKGKRLSLLTALLSISILAYISCRKIDTVSIEKPHAETVEKFLNLPASASPEVKRIAERLKELNKRANFLNEIAKHDGFPVWEKAVVKKLAANRRQTNGRINNTTDTIVYIPLVLPNANQVSAFIYARLNGSINLRLHRAGNYDAYGFGTLQDSTNNAEKLAVQFMLLDNVTFGHTDFKILDNRLFKDNALPSGAVTKDKKVHITRQNNSPQARIEFWDYDVCTSERYWQCPSNGDCCTWAGVGLGECSSCEGCWKTRSVCKKTTIMVYVDDDWYPGGGGPPPGDGGGGTGGGGSTGPTPCNPTPELDNGLPPCPELSKDGWMPDPTLLDPNAATAIKIDTSISNHFLCLTSMLNSMPNINREAQLLLDSVFNVSAKVNLTFAIDNNLVGTNYAALTYPTSVSRAMAGSVEIFNDTVFINPYFVQRATKEFMVGAIYHEAIHAYINYQFYRFLNNEVDSMYIKTRFPIFWNKLISSTSLTSSLFSQAHHEQMASSYINTLKSLIIPFYNPIASGPMKERGSESLAWGGLKNTTAWSLPGKDTCQINADLQAASLANMTTMAGGGGACPRIPVNSFDLKLSDPCQ